MSGRIVGFSPGELSSFTNDVEKSKELIEKEEDLKHRKPSIMPSHGVQISLNGETKQHDAPATVKIDSRSSFSDYIPRGLSERQQLNILLRQGTSGSDVEVKEEETFFEDIPAPPRPRKVRHVQHKRRADYIGGDTTERWSPAKKKAFESFKANPNAFYYRHTAPKETQSNGKWDARELLLFFHALNNAAPNNRWGLFSMNIPGRVGYQCRNFYHHLLKQGVIVDPEYSTPDGRYTVKRMREASGIYFKIIRAKAISIMKSLGGDEADVEEMLSILDSGEKDEANEMEVDAAQDLESGSEIQYSPKKAPERKASTPKRRKVKSESRKSASVDEDESDETFGAAAMLANISKRRRRVQPDKTLETLFSVSEDEYSRYRDDLKDSKRELEIANVIKTPKHTSNIKKLKTRDRIYHLSDNKIPFNGKMKMFYARRIADSNTFRNSATPYPPTSTSSYMDSLYSIWERQIEQAQRVEADRLERMYADSASTNNSARMSPETYEALKSKSQDQFNQQWQTFRMMKMYSFMPPLQPMR